MSDGDVTAVLDFVRGGGGLVSIGPYGTEDELGQSRTVGLIEQLQPLARVTKAGSEASSPPTSQPQESRGRVVSLQTAGRVSEIWMRTQSGIKAGPVSASVALPEAVESSLGRPLSVAGIPLGPVGIEWTVSDDGNRYVLHRVNFDPRMPAAPTKVTLRVAPRRKVSKVACYRAGTSPENIAFRAAGNAVTFKSAELDVYDAYLIHTESSAPSDHP
jgi:hypothetical protein